MYTHACNIQPLRPIVFNHIHNIHATFAQSKNFKSKR